MNHYVSILTRAVQSSVKFIALKNVVDVVDPGSGVHIFSGSSDVPEQPEGCEETLQGARNRARKAKQKLPRCYAVGIENGIRWNADHWEDFAIVVIINPAGVERIEESYSVTVPTAYVEEARKRGFDRTTVGKVMSEILGISETDPHSFLTNGRMSRRAILEDAIKRHFSNQKMECAS